MEILTSKIKDHNIAMEMEYKYSKEMGCRVAEAARPPVMVWRCNVYSSASIKDTRLPVGFISHSACLLAATQPVNHYCSVILYSLFLRLDSMTILPLTHLCWVQLLNHLCRELVFITIIFYSRPWPMHFFSSFSFILSTLHLAWPIRIWHGHDAITLSTNQSRSKTAWSWR